MSITDSGPFHRALHLRQDESLDSSLLCEALAEKGYSAQTAEIIVGDLFDALEEKLLESRVVARLGAVL